MTQDTIKPPRPPMTMDSVIIRIAAFINILALIFLAYRSYELGIWVKTNIAIMGLLLMNIIVLLGADFKARK
jgi:hypothetical protein